MRPSGDGCSWLYLEVNGDAQCADSLKAWLAASVVGAQSSWDRLATREAELLDEMRRQPQLTLSEGVKELLNLPMPGEQGFRGGWNSLRYEGHDPEGPLTPPLGDYADALRELGPLRTGAMLTSDETYLLPHRGGVTLVRLWDDRGFRNTRLNPHDWERAIVVIHPRDGGVELMQVPDGRGGAIYLDHEDRAFQRFKDWVDYSRAQTRILQRETKRVGYYVLPPNIAALPRG
jgi:hypothetical protein